jgi:hypothetical protein
MSFQKPEKDFGEGPVRPSHHLDTLDATNNFPENPQNPHNLDLAKGRLFGESLL